MTTKTVLHHYLGTGLKFEDWSGQINELKSVYFYEKGDIFVNGYSLIEVKPALHSMNRLTQPLENGDIPILMLAKIAFPEQDWKLVDKCAKFNRYYSFFYSEGFQLVYNGIHLRVNNQLECFQYLINNHFNCFSLPESEYIEKSTLK